MSPNVILFFLKQQPKIQVGKLKLSDEIMKILEQNNEFHTFLNDCINKHIVCGDTSSSYQKESSTLNIITDLERSETIITIK